MLTQLWSGLPAGNDGLGPAWSRYRTQRHARSKAVMAAWKATPRRSTEGPLRNGNQLLRGVARSRSLDGSQLSLVFGELLLDPLLRGMPLDDVFAVAPEEVVDRLNPDANRPGRLVLIQILEAEVGRAGPLDDAFDNAVNRRIVAALEARHLERDQVRMARREFGGPHFVVRAGGIGLLPHVVDFERM